MKRYFALFFGLLFAVLLSFSNSVAEGSLSYHVSIQEPQTHYFDVSIELKDYDEDYVEFKMPVWTPGSYLVREYAKNVEQFTAACLSDGKELAVQKTNKNTWRVDLDKRKGISIQYRVYAFEGYVRMSYLDADQAMIMANTLLMYVDDLREQSSILTLDYPDRWSSISTSLSKVKDKENAYYVPNYDILVDSPIEIGNHRIIEFEAAGVPHELAIVGSAQLNQDRLVRDLTKMIETATNIFEDNPNERYTFIIQTDRRAGGLEHMSSTVMGVDRWTFSTKKGYEYFLSLAAHEYFHLWMVKRLKPVELLEIDYDTEVYTDLLWVMEGFTSYFEEKIMMRCGFYSEERFINNQLKIISEISNRPGSRAQSLSEASFDAWIKFYRQNENSLNTQTSYYDKGQVIGALLDLEIIAGSEGKSSLDDVINQLYYQYFKKKDRGITSENLKKAAEKAGKTDLTEFFDDYIFGTAPLDIERFFGYAGLDLIEKNGERNGKTLGMVISSSSTGLTIKSLYKGSAAYERGINVGDELIAINKHRVNESNLSSIIASFEVGEEVDVLVSRHGLLRTIKVDVRRDKSVNYAYQVSKNRSKQQIAVYQTWLSK